MYTGAEGGVGVSASVHAGISPPEKTPPEQTPPEQTSPRDTATAADGTHPTGMHSCYTKLIDLVFLYCFVVKCNINSAKTLCPMLTDHATLRLWHLWCLHSHA